MTRRKPGQPGSTRAHQQLPADVADLIGAGALPPTGTKARLRFPATVRFMEGLVDGYCQIDGALHLRLARSERDETGAVRAIRRTVRWATVEACSWDVAPTRRDELHAVPAPHARATPAAAAKAPEPGDGAATPWDDDPHPFEADLETSTPGLPDCCKRCGRHEHEDGAQHLAQAAAVPA